MGPGRCRGRGAARRVLVAAGLLSGDQRGDDAPWDGDAAAERAESWRGADNDTEPASADVPPPVATSTPVVAAQLPERLRGGYAGERGDDGSHRGKPPRRDRLLRGGERVHDPQSRRCGASAVSESEAMTLELSSGAIRDNARESGPAAGRRSRGWPPVTVIPARTAGGLSEVMGHYL
jgi:hypothetical protein